MDFEDIYKKIENKENPLAVVGLGYVGLPLALALGEHFSVVGFDIDEQRINELKAGNDVTGESGELLSKVRIDYTSDPKKIADCPLVIIAVPTPITNHKTPDLGPLESAIRMVGQNNHNPSVMVIESTVYPGATEMISEKILEKELGLKRGKHFKLGYSPERINPGDKKHTLKTITKIIAAEDKETLALLKSVYGKITKVHATSNIATAEAAKVIENIQRDLNIALVNELAMIFSRMDIDTNEVIDAAATKWNFHPYRPGLVGGHCVGVDPYYLTHRAEHLGYIPEVILAGRRINESIGEFIAEKTIKLLIESGRNVRESKVAILGITFKENINDIRNSKVIDIIKILREHHVEILITDARASVKDVKLNYGIKLDPESEIKNVDAIILCVAHDEYLNRGEDAFLQLTNKKSKPIFVDVKSAYEAEKLPNFVYWRL